jgi:ATP-dependent Clp protease ATP-binding subunit ClpA
VIGREAEIEPVERRLAENPESDIAVGEQEIADVMAARNGIPVGQLVASELERLGTLEADLHRRVIGQTAAVHAVAETVRHARAGLAEPDRPQGSFLFMGPTGVGKTELVKALAERLFATEKSLVRIDMSADRHRRSRRRTWFRCIEGFSPAAGRRPASRTHRIDEIVVFDSLTEDEVQRIGELLWSRIADRLREERDVELEVDPELVARLAREGFDAEFGARPLKRHLRRTLEKELTRAILDGRIDPGTRVRATDGDDGERSIALEVLEPATV